MKKIFLIAAMAFGFTIVSGAFVEANAQTHTVKVEHKKCWSHRKKYGVIGGVVGGASGYLLGRHKDRKYPNRRTYKTKKRVD